MIVETCKQGSGAWHQARLGIPTASKFSHILTPATRKVSTQVDGYLQSLLAEWLVGVPSDAEASGFMDRGKQLEPLARHWYSFKRDVDVQEVGIVLRDDRMVGASPDGLVGDDGLIEIKIHSAKVHVAHLLEGLAVGSYFAQIQGGLLLTGRKWTDLVAYQPTEANMPPIVLRVERDEAFIAALDAAVSVFVRHLLAARARLVELGCTPAKRLLVTPSMVSEDPF